MQLEMAQRRFQASHNTGVLFVQETVLKDEARAPPNSHETVVTCAPPPFLTVVMALSQLLRTSEHLDPLLCVCLLCVCPCVRAGGCVQARMRRYKCLLLLLALWYHSGNSRRCTGNTQHPHPPHHRSLAFTHHHPNFTLVCFQPGATRKGGPSSLWLVRIFRWRSRRSRRMSLTKFGWTRLGNFNYEAWAGHGIAGLPWKGERAVLLAF
jgi:hypothetical protein